MARKSPKLSWPTRRWSLKLTSSRGDAFHALLLSTSLGAPAPLKLTAERLSALVALAPAYFVDTGNDPSAIPDAIEEFAARF